MSDRILDATERLIGRLGYQKMTMDDIAREAGVGRRTIYLHFPSKEQTALATIDRIVERLKARLEMIASSDAAYEDRLRAMLLERVMFRFDSVREYYQGIDEIFRSLRPVYMAQRARYFAEQAAIFAAVLRSGRDGGAFEFDDASTTAETLLLSTNALLPSSLSTRELGKRTEVEARASRIADLLLRGLRVGPARTTSRESTRPTRQRSTSRR